MSTTYSKSDAYKMVNIIPEGKSGDWTIEKFTVEPNVFQGFRPRFVPPGEYLRLKRRGTVVMSDTPDEIRDHRYAISEAKGHVLIAGLGIGMVAKACLDKPEVTKVTVVEKSEDVIALTGPTLMAMYGDRLEIVHADIFEYKAPKGVTYGMAWFDIWDDICVDNLPEMQKLHRKFGKNAAWKGSWARELCELHRSPYSHRRYP
jgi:hypothetical protein